MKTKQRLPRKKHPYLNAAKAVTIILTAIYPVFMTMMTGAGILYNRSSYGSSFARYGTLLIISGCLMTAGTVLCIFRKNLPSLLAPFFSASGLIMCLSVLSRLVKHANAHGWHGSGIYENVSAGYTFQLRLLPCILPAVSAAVIALCQYFSYDLSDLRRERRSIKENAPAPSIISGE